MSDSRPVAERASATPAFAVDPTISLRAVADRIPAMVAAYDEHGRYRWANREYRERLGVGEDELRGRTVAEVVGPAAWSVIAPHFAGALAGEERRFEGDIQLPFGKRFGAVSMTPDCGEDGCVRGVVTIVVDPSEARRALDESQSWYRALVETTYDWIWEVDAEGRYTFAGPVVEKFLGYRPDEVIGKTPFDFMRPAEAARVGRLFAEIVTNRRPFAALVNVNLHRAGHEIVLETSGVPVFGADGELRGYRGVDRDVTERVRLEGQLRRAQRLEALGLLAGGIAHDFNNLLSVIGAASELALGELRPGEPLHADLAEIRAASLRAEAVTRQLLAFSRHQLLEPRAIEPAALLHGLETMLRRLLGEGLSVSCDVAASTGRFKADPGQIEQVVMNLAINARDAMPSGGRLAISARDARIGAERAAPLGIAEGDYVAITVADTGIGMDAATVARIFEPFFTTKPVGKGTGLGLATAYGIVRQSGGAIAVSSTPGVGTAFEVLLPRTLDAPADGFAPTAQSAHAASLGAEMILVVEDEGPVRKLLGRLLTKAGYTPLLAADATEALRLARDRGPEISLILTDVILPGAGGHELSAQLSPLCVRAKVVFMSGYSDDVVARHGVRDVGVRFLAKPFSGESLRRTVREAIDG
jgi:PAS domain S-box-containing protein